MTISSLLFRRQPATSPETGQPKALDQMVKPWPLTSAQASSTADEGEDTWISTKSPSAVVRDRLAQFITRS